MIKYTCSALNRMLSAGLSADEHRRQLSNVVICLLELPAGWKVTAEYFDNFGHRNSIQLRYKPADNAEYCLCLCSPSKMLPTWSLFIVALDGTVNKILHHSSVLEPEVINELLRKVDAMRSFNFAPHIIADLLSGKCN